jgi:hypothetical protein
LKHQIGLHLKVTKVPFLYQDGGFLNRGTPNHPFFHGFSLENHPAIGVSPNYIMEKPKNKAMDFDTMPWHCRCQQTLDI